MSADIHDIAREKGPGVAIITGGSQGIGAGLVAAYAYSSLSHRRTSPARSCTWTVAWSPVT